MDGRAVIHGVMQHGPKLIDETVKEAGLTLDDITLFLFHQANENLIKRFSKELEIPKDKVFLNVYKYGNTSSASSLIAYHEAKNEGRLQEGSICAFIAFSAGFYINCMIYRHGTWFCIKTSQILNYTTKINIFINIIYNGNQKEV